MLYMVLKNLQMNVALFYKLVRLKKLTIIFLFITNKKDICVFHCFYISNSIIIYIFVLNVLIINDI